MNMNKYECAQLGSWYINWTIYKTLLRWNFQKRLIKLRSLWIVHFAISIPIILTLAFDKEVLYQNVKFLIVALSSKKQYSLQFYKKNFSFSENLFQS